MDGGLEHPQLPVIVEHDDLDSIKRPQVIQRAEHVVAKMHEHDNFSACARRGQKRLRHRRHERSFPNDDHCKKYDGATESSELAEGSDGK